MKKQFKDSVSANQKSRWSRRLLLAACLLSPAGPALGTIYVWDGGASTVNFADANNWNPNGIPGTDPLTDLIRFDGTTTGSFNNNLASGTILNALQFRDSSAVTISGNTLNVNGAGGDIPSSTSGNTLISAPIASADGQSLNFNVSGTGILTSSGGISGITAVTGALIKAGTGTMVISGSTTSTTPTYVNNGELIMNGGTSSSTLFRIGGNTGAINTTLSLEQSFTTTADLVSRTGATGTNTLASKDTDRTLSGAIALNKNLIIDVETGTTLTTSGNITGAAGFTKTGDGTLNLSGTNTYSGTTIIDSGTLLLGADNTLSSTSQIDLSGGTLAANGKEDTTAGSLLLSSSSVLDMSGSGGSELWFANSSGPAWTGALSIWNWTPGTTILRFGTTSGGLDPAQLSQITLYSGAGSGTSIGARLDSNGYLVAIPEPGSIGIVLLILTGIGWKERHHLLHQRQPFPPHLLPG